jgi:hypothetical protein
MDGRIRRGGGSCPIVYRVVYSSRNQLELTIPSGTNKTSNESAAIVDGTDSVRSPAVVRLRAHDTVRRAIMNA